jgi:hypothetical protein
MLERWQMGQLKRGNYYYWKCNIGGALNKLAGEQINKYSNKLFFLFGECLQFSNKTNKIEEGKVKRN